MIQNCSIAFHYTSNTLKTHYLLNVFLRYDLHKLFHPSFTNITMSINNTLPLYENYVCLQFDIKAKMVNLPVEVDNLKL